MSEKRRCRMTDGNPSERAGLGKNDLVMGSEEIQGNDLGKYTLGK